MPDACSVHRCPSHYRRTPWGVGYQPEVLLVLRSFVRSTTPYLVGSMPVKWDEDEKACERSGRECDGSSRTDDGYSSSIASRNGHEKHHRYTWAWN